MTTLTTGIIILVAGIIAIGLIITTLWLSRAEPVEITDDTTPQIGGSSIDDIHPTYKLTKKQDTWLRKSYTILNEYTKENYESDSVETRIVNVLMGKIESISYRGEYAPNDQSWLNGLGEIVKLIKSDTFPVE